MTTDNTTWTSSEETPTPPADKLPQPALWRILVRPVAPKKQTKGGIILSDISQEAEEYNNCRGQVLAMGPLCYTAAQFRPIPDGASVPGCKVGDWITYGKYAGQKLTVCGVKMLILNDDEVTSVLPDPTVLTSYV